MYQIDFVLGDFNINGLDVDSCRLLKEILFNYELMLDFPTHIDGGMLDHVYVSKNVMESFDAKILKKCINMSDHDAIKIELVPKENDSDYEAD